MNYQTYKKSAWIDFLICLFFGFYGIHKFREKKIGVGLLYLFSGGLLTFGWLYDCAVYLYIAFRINNTEPETVADENEKLKLYPKAKKIGKIIAISWLAIFVLIALCTPNTNSDNPIIDDSNSIVEQTNNSTDELESNNSNSLSEDTISNESKSDTPDTTVTEKPNEESQETPNETHTHSFASATCTTAKVCACGAEEGTALGHNWNSATCNSPKTCSLCGETSGNALGHSYSNGKCTSCGSKDPNYVSETMVWIPTKGGSKYHSKSTCSQMDGPNYVTKSEAERLGFGPCGRCY